MADQEPRKLSPIDPVPPETLDILNRLEVAHVELATRLLRLEQDRIRILAKAHEVDLERQRTFDRLLVERGLSPKTQVDIDANTGAITVLEPAQQ